MDKNIWLASLIIVVHLLSEVHCAHEERSEF